MCIRDRYNTEPNKSQENITVLENIDNFKPSEIKMIQQYENYILKSNVDYNSCKNISCIINRTVSKDDENLYGYYQYLWFLKTGYTTNMTNQKILNKETIPFSDEESKELFKSTWHIPASMLRLKTLKTFHRLNFSDTIDGDPNSCGIHYSGIHSIVFSDKCLDLGIKNGKYPEMRQSVLHETAHALSLIHI